MLRFNGFSPVGANPWSAQCSSPIGNVSGVVGANANLRTLYGRGDRHNQRYAFGMLASTPNATEPPIAWIMAEKGGDLACENSVNQGNTTTNFVQMGINLIGDMDQDGTLTPDAALSMITSMSADLAALGELTGPMQMTMNIAADLAQEGQINASLGLIAWCSAQMDQSTSVSASNLRGTQSMAASIVSYGDLTPEGIRDAVWQAVLAQYSTSGSAGNTLALAGSGGVDYTALGVAVWNSVSRTLTSGAAPSTSDISNAVWTAVARTLTAGAAPSTSDIAIAVWAYLNRTLTSGAAPSTADIATAVWEALDRTLTSGAAPSVADITAALEAAVLPVNAVEMNDTEIIGTGVVTDKWRGVGEPA